MKIARFLAFLCALGILMATLACGKKGDPFLPQKEVSAKVTNLRGEGEKGAILLRGEIRGPKDVQGARVYYAQFPLEDPHVRGAPLNIRATSHLAQRWSRRKAFFAKSQ